MFETPLARFGLVILLAVTAFTVAVGGRSERFAALLVATNWILNNLLVVRHDTRGMPWADFVLDSVFAVAFVWLAIRSRRRWAAFLAAFQVLGVANYVSYLLDLTVWHRTFITTSYAWAFGALASVLAAGLMALSDRRQPLQEKAG